MCWPIISANGASISSANPKIFVENFISHCGVLLELNTDQGRNFDLNLFVEMCKLLRINKCRTTALHPQLNGKVERFNRTLLQHLSKVVDEHQEDWDHYFALFTLAYQSSVHESTYHTPTKVILGHELRLPCDLEFDRIWYITGEADIYQQICHRDEKSSKENLQNC